MNITNSRKVTKHYTHNLTEYYRLRKSYRKLRTLNYGNLRNIMKYYEILRKVSCKNIQNITDYEILCLCNLAMGLKTYKIFHALNLRNITLTRFFENLQNITKYYAYVTFRKFTKYHGILRNITFT